MIADADELARYKATNERLAHALVAAVKSRDCALAKLAAHREQARRDALEEAAKVADPPH